MLNTQWLHTFITLVEVGHFTQTAEKLFMTQPGVSQHIKKLEEQAGTPLIKRIGKRFELTPAGQQLYRYGVKRQEDEKQLLGQLLADDPFSGECHLACSGSLAMFLYPHFLKHQQKHQGISIHLESAPNHRILEGIKNGQFDIGIVTHSVDDQYFDQQRIGQEALCVVVPTSYPEDQLSKDAIYSFGFIDHPDGKHYLQQVHLANYSDSHFDFSKITKKGYINQLNQILLPVSEGLGFTVLPEKAVSQFSDQDKIKTLPLPNTVKQELYLLRKQHRPLPKRYLQIIDAIQRLLNQS
ncbi:LysR family transcriptional regulator [Photobacterium gaetbulicola]|uniref:LysR family transcriptional regulator n=1 Tax=Photobacterium gaetbulicola TaxID=1295392 RepID=A0A0B9G0H6_9GAMM|nr:LysR family transcriptional regulator [Photobacterium gaetbulicola]KHT62193.1 LysR family transcriptional regulator [Photobacterium gaetbulicola]